MLDQDEKLRMKHALAEGRMELTKEEAEALLEEELSKPEEEMNTVLIDELLAVLEPDTPDAASRERIWKRLEGDLKRKQAASVGRRVAVWAANAAADEIKGYRVKPTWMPERFTFCGGTVFVDVDMTKTDALFTCDQRVCIVSVMVFAADGNQMAVDYEKLHEPKDQRDISGCPVTYYHNINGAVLSAAWQIDSTCNSVAGPLTEDEMAQIIRGMFY